ncbi:MAG: hypothetical protein ABL930_13945, partial [Pseudobdellovibrio sp.]
MNLMSTNNSFYRYKIEDINDISESTYLRRQNKAAQNNKKCFFFEVASNLKYPDLSLDFLAQKINPNDRILCSINTYGNFLKKISTEHFIIEIANVIELNSLKSKLDFLKNTPIFFTPKIST